MSELFGEGSDGLQEYIPEWDTSQWGGDELSESSPAWGIPQQSEDGYSLTGDNSSNIPRQETPSVISNIVRTTSENASVTHGSLCGVSVVDHPPTSFDAADRMVSVLYMMIIAFITLDPNHAPLLPLLLCLYLTNYERSISTTAPALKTLRDRLTKWDDADGGVDFFKFPGSKTIFTVVKGAGNGVYNNVDGRGVSLDEKKRLAVFVLMWSHRLFGDYYYHIVSFCAADTTENSKVTNTGYYLCAPCFCGDASEFFRKSIISGFVQFDGENSIPIVKSLNTPSISVCDEISIPDSPSSRPKSIEEEYRTAVLRIVQGKKQKPVPKKPDGSEKRSHHKPKQPRLDVSSSSAQLPQGVFGLPGSMFFALPPPEPTQSNVGQLVISESGTVPTIPSPQSCETQTEFPSGGLPLVTQNASNHDVNQPEVTDAVGQAEPQNICPQTLVPKDTTTRSDVTETCFPSGPIPAPVSYQFPVGNEEHDQSDSVPPPLVSQDDQNTDSISVSLPTPYGDNYNSSYDVSTSYLPFISLSSFTLYPSC